jgi:hypothetical protein
VSHLVITPATVAAISHLADRAHSSPYTLVHTRKLFRTPLPERSLIVPHGHRVTFTVGQFRPGWRCRHLMVSGPRQWPAPYDVYKLMELFGFRGKWDECFTWADGHPNRRAVNVVEPLDGDWSPMRNA